MAYGNNCSVIRSKVCIISRYDSLRKEVHDDEIAFQSDIQLPHQLFSWQHKFTPQKPIFFNKIKMGYDWNQYKQVHYDAKNPPPKVIHGYLFNIFYPELVDKTQRPSFLLEPDKNDDNWCTIRFHAGAPYEDVAFRVGIKEEWGCRL